MIPVHVISLPCCADRRARLKERLDAFGIPFTFFDAVDGRALSQSELDEIAPPELCRRGLQRMPMTAGEVGCALSHLRLVDRHQTDEFFCVLEDDAVPLPGITDFLDEALLRRLPKFDILRLYSPSYVWSKYSTFVWLKYPTFEVAKVNGRSICAMLIIGGSGAAQIFSAEGARKVTSNISVITAPIDFILYMMPQVKGLRVLEVRPSVANDTGDSNSIIGHRPTIPRPNPLVLLFIRGLRRTKLIVEFVRTWVIGENVLRYPRWRPDS
jgi:glycosyl transferase family 25